MEPQNNIPSVDESQMKMPSETAPMSPKHNVLNGLVIFLLVAILAALGFGLYLWGTNMPEVETVDEFARPTAEENNEPESTTAEAQTETLQAVSTSDEIDAIEADLDATFINDLDAEFAAIEAELSASGN